MQQRNGFTAAQKKMMILSNETTEGLKITGIATKSYNTNLMNAILMLFVHAVKSFVEMTRYLLALPGVKFVLSERFFQNPLEAFFGKQRAQGGRNDNPTVQQFLKNTVSLRSQVQ